jgi:hypothetical protein
MPGLHWYYLSFVGEEGWRGATYVPAFNMKTASQVAHLLGVNPGGEVVIVAVPDDKIPDFQYRYVLMDAETARNSTLSPRDSFKPDVAEG